LELVLLDVLELVLLEVLLEVFEDVLELVLLDVFEDVFELVLLEVFEDVLELVLLEVFELVVRARSCALSWTSTFAGCCCAAVSAGIAACAAPMPAIAAPARVEIVKRCLDISNSIY
jgi:hypothetical protein